MIDAPAARVASALADRYRIERELGQGGMATVYLAEDLKHHRQVAIKVLKPELAAVLGAERFVQEIATTAALQHPNVLPLFESGTADGFLYYVMPYVDGETLRAKLDRETQLGVDESVKLVGEIADALQYAHDHGVVHRDIKPENILLHAGRPMVADFGIALAVSAAAGGRMTETGLSLGTPHYMSPEQATAEKTITNRSDIYSLAAVLYEMLAGEPPHMGNSAQAIIMKIVTDDARPIGELRKSVPAYVAAAIAKALQRVPADRFESARGFSSALNDPSFASSAEGASRRLAATPLRGARRWKAIAGIAAALIVVGAAGAWVGSRRSTVEPTVATVSINLAPSDDLSAARPIDRRANADRPTTDALAFAPDGRTLVFAGWRSGHRLLLRRSIATGETTPIAGTDGAEVPFFSPDGHTVGFWANGWLQRVPLDGGTPVQIAPVTRPAGASWGDDGGIVYSELHAALRRVAASGGTPEQLQTPVGAHLPWVLLGAKAVLYTVAYGFDFAQRRIEVLDLKAGIRTTVLDNAADARYLANGYLAFARVGQLMVAPFDPSTRRVTGGAVGVLSDVMQAIGGSNTGTFTDAAQHTVSRNGDLAWLGGGITPRANDAVVIRDRHGNTISIDAPRGPSLMERFAPGGREIAVSSARSDAGGIWIIDPDRAGSVRSIISALVSFFTWSPDGTHLAAESGDSLVLVAAEGGSAPVTIAGGSGEVPAQWLSGDTILTVASNKNVGEVPVAGGTPRVVLTDPGALGYPAVSPDGRWLVYTATDGNQENVVLRQWPSLAGRRVVAAGAQPAWARGGRELLFQAIGNGHVMAVDVGSNGAMGVPHEVLNQALRVVHPIRSWDVSADGERFLDTVSDSAAFPPAPVIHVTLGWFRQIAGKGQ